MRIKIKSLLLFGLLMINVLKTENVQAGQIGTQPANGDHFAVLNCKSSLSATSNYLSVYYYVPPGDVYPNANEMAVLNPARYDYLMQHCREIAEIAPGGTPSMKLYFSLSSTTVPSGSCRVSGVGCTSNAQCCYGVCDMLSGACN